MAIMAEWKRKWQDIWFKNGFCTTLTGPEIENAAYTCRSVVHGGASLLASKLAWNYINCVMVKLQLCLIVLWAGLINSVPPSPVSPHRAALQQSDLLHPATLSLVKHTVCHLRLVISQHALTCYKKTMDHADWHLFTERNSKLRPQPSRSQLPCSNNTSLSWWILKQLSSAPQRKHCVDQLQLEFVMAINNIVLDVSCFGRMFEHQSYVVENYGPG
jgi:hypothetical protein